MKHNISVSDHLAYILSPLIGLPAMSLNFEPCDGVTTMHITNHLSMGEHVRDVIGNAATLWSCCAITVWVTARWGLFNYKAVVLSSGVDLWW